jgi:DNA-binding response OmpR family regulator
MKVMVADDDRIGRRLLERRLSRLGYQVVQACEGLEAWRSFYAGTGSGVFAVSVAPERIRPARGRR